MSVHGTATYSARLAADLAFRAHDGQLRKWSPSNEPYFAHVEAVAIRVSEIPGAQPQWIAAAYLHDVLEDTDAVMRWIMAEATERLPLHHPASPGGPPPRDELGED